MREKLNSNPLYQAAIIGVLLLAVVFFFISTTGKGEEEEGATATESAVAVVEGEEGAATAAAPPPGALTKAAPPPPAPVLTAFEQNQVVVLLFVRDDGVDERMVAGATARLDALEDVTTFVVPAKQIARYATIAQGVDVSRVPALVVIRPKSIDRGIPSASVAYGYQSPESVEQAVVDAGYKGPTLAYHP